MELTSRSPLRGKLSSRTGTLTVAALVAAVAAILVLAALRSARNDGAASGTASVIVADRLIPKGSSGAAIAGGHLYRATEVSGSSLVAGAVTDVSQLRGKIATDDIYPGQQISTADFTDAGGALTAKLATDQRAMSIPIDAAHGMIGDIHAGDRVDVLAGFSAESDAGRTRPVMTVLARNIPVLKAPGSADSSGDKQITLKVPDAQAAQFAFAADNGKVWIVLRPAAGAHDSTVRLVSLQSLLFGLKPIQGGGAR